MYCGVSQMKSPCLALDKLIVIPAVKVMKIPQLHQGLFDLCCWLISNTTCHQSLFQPKELQLTFDPSPLLPFLKVGTLNFGRLTAFQNRVFGGGGFWVTDIWDVKKMGGRVQRHWLVGLVGAGSVLKVLIVPPALSSNSFCNSPA